MTGQVGRLVDCLEIRDVAVKVAGDEHFRGVLKLHEPPAAAGRLPHGVRCFVECPEQAFGIGHRLNIGIWINRAD